MSTEQWSLMFLVVLILVIELLAENKKINSTLSLFVKTMFTKPGDN